MKVIDVSIRLRTIHTMMLTITSHLTNLKHEIIITDVFITLTKSQCWSEGLAARYRRHEMGMIF